MTKKKIVIGEPSPMVGKILRDKLLREGHDVTWLAEVPEIDARLREDPPDLLIMNAMVPEGHGLKILQSIPRREGKLPYPVILTFDQALYPEEEEKLTAHRPSAILPMPFKPTEVARQVRELLAR